MTTARDVIASLRAGTVPNADELKWFAQGLADSTVTDAQAGAFAMAVCLGGLDKAGRSALTLAMRDSGRVITWDKGPVLDKHSTGGIGDPVSLILAPALAACGAIVPMISGRGLGHTGGTLDKLEAIPGVSTQVSERQMKRVVDLAGCAIVSATADITPADKRLYAIRDVTATVDSIDLITASILSKKLAAGLDALVLDVKAGSGAFMKSAQEARVLAAALVQTANAAGCKTLAMVTDMDQPISSSIGNALEIGCVMEELTGTTSGPLTEIASTLGGVLLAEAGLAPDRNAGEVAIKAAVTDGRAAERFGKMVSALGGPVAFVENWQRFLPEAPVIREVKSGQSGYLARMDGEALGLASVGLGAGRAVESDVINPAVGFSDVVRLGSFVNKGDPLAVIHAARPEDADRAEVAVRGALSLTEDKPATPDLIMEHLT